MIDSPPSSQPPAETRQTVRGRSLARRLARTEWRQSCFDLVSAGHSYAEVAKLLMVSERTVRRDVARVISDRRLDSPERYIHMQVDRLTRAMRTADERVGRGDMKAVAPLIKLIGALDRYHGLDGRYRREPQLSLPSDRPQRRSRSPRRRKILRKCQNRTRKPLRRFDPDQKRTRESLACGRAG